MDHKYLLLRSLSITGEVYLLESYKSSSVTHAGRWRATGIARGAASVAQRSEEAARTPANTRAP